MKIVFIGNKIKTKVINFKSITNRICDKELMGLYYKFAWSYRKQRMNKGKAIRKHHIKISIDDLWMQK